MDGAVLEAIGLYRRAHVFAISMASYCLLDAAMGMYNPEGADFETNEAAQGICDLWRKAFETNDWSVLEPPDGPWNYSERDQSKHSCFFRKEKKLSFCYQTRFTLLYLELALPRSFTIPLLHSFTQHHIQLPVSHITTHIAKYLSIGDLKSCVQVSRGFESHITSHLWHTIRLKQLKLVCRGARVINGCPHKCAIPIVIWNAGSVKKLYFDAGTFVHGLNRLQKMLLLECTNVEKLEVEALEDDDGGVPNDLEEEAWAILTKLLKANRKLRSIHLHTSPRYCNEAWIEALATLSHLEDIHVDNVVIPTQPLARLLRLMPADAATVSSITLCNSRIIGSFRASRVLRHSAV